MDEGGMWAAYVRTTHTNSIARLPAKNAQKVRKNLAKNAQKTRNNFAV